MSAGAALVIQNTIDRIEALTATTKHGGTLRFKHVGRVSDAEDLTDARSNSRKFILVPTGSRSLVGFLSTDGEMTSVQQVFDLSVIYPVGRQIDLFKVICEDVDSIGRQLMLVGDFSQSTTGIERRIVEGYSIDVDDSGGSAIVTIPITVRYTPDFS